MPQLEPYWAAGFSFSRGHFKLRVPYDAYQPMVFQVSAVQCSAVQGKGVEWSAVTYIEWTILICILINISSLQGEEINVGIRGFTHGYDFYAPRDSVVFHEYAQKSSRRKKIPMFW